MPENIVIINGKKFDVGNFRCLRGCPPGCILKGEGNHLVAE